MKNLSIKKCFFVFVLSILISTIFSINSSAAILSGDVNNDGITNIIDLVRLKKYVVGINTEINELASDINCDDKINAMDLSALRKILLNGEKEVEVSREPDEIENF